MAASLTSRAALCAAALQAAGCIFLLDADELSAGREAAGKAGQGGAGAGAAGSAGGASGAGKAGAGGGAQGGSAGSGARSCALSLGCEDGDPCTQDRCLMGDKDCDQEDCVGDGGEGLGECVTAPWTGAGFGLSLPPSALLTAESFGKAAIAAVPGGFLVAALRTDLSAEDVVLVRVDNDNQVPVKKLGLRKLMEDSGAKGFVPLSSPGLEVTPQGEVLAVFGGQQADKKGVFAAIVDPTALALKTWVQVSADGYDASAQEHAPQVFAINSDGSSFLSQWVGPPGQTLRYAGIGWDKAKLKPPSQVNDWGQGGNVKALAAVRGTGSAWGALALHGVSVEAWHPSGKAVQIPGAKDVTQPAGMTAARLGDGFSLAAYASGTPQSGGEIYLRLIACSADACDVGTLQGDIGADKPVPGLYPALHARPLAVDGGPVQLAIANMLYPPHQGAIGYLGLLTIDRFLLSQEGQGYVASEAPQVNPRYALFPEDLTESNLSTPRSAPTVNVDEQGRVGVAWTEGQAQNQSLRFARYGVTQCP